MSNNNGILIVKVEHILSSWDLLLKNIENYIEKMLDHSDLSMNQLIHWREIDLRVKTIKTKNKPTTGLEASVLLKTINKQNDTPYCLGDYILFSDPEYTSYYYIYNYIMYCLPTEYIKI